MQLINYNPPVYKLLGEEDIETIHKASMRILSEMGIRFQDEEARSILRKNGARVTSDMAFFDEALILEYVSKAPDQFTLLARNPANNLIVGGRHMVFAPVYGPPFVLDLEGKRRQSTLADFEDFVRLAYLCPYMHHSGGTVVEPNDVPLNVRHLDMTLCHIKSSDKALMGSVTSGSNAADSVAMAEIVFGREKIRERPALISLINVNSPRVFDQRMLAACKVHTRARQAVIITPFIMAGAVSPVSIAGTLAQQNAEALAGIALTQMIEPGAPVVYGSFTTNVDLRTGAPIFGTPESQTALYVSAQLARRYGLPFRGGGMLNTAKLPDAQAAYESLMVMWATTMAGTNFVLHAAGWLDGGLVAGFEKFVLDCEILGMIHTWSQGLDLSDESMAFDAHAEVSPGGTYLATQHTMRHFRDAFFRADIFDYDMYEHWLNAGANDVRARAARKVRQLLADYTAPALDPGIKEALHDYVNSRKRNAIAN